MNSLTSIRIDAFTLHRLLRPHTLQRAVAICKIAFLIAIFLLLVVLTAATLEEFFKSQATLDRLESQSREISAANAAPTTSETKETDYREIYEKSIFGELSPQAAAKPEPEKPKTELSLALIGTFIAPSGSEAIIEDTRKQSQEVFAIGDSIFDSATLTAVFSDRVEIQRDGRTEILALYDGPEAGAGGAAGGADEEIVVDEQELTEALDNLPLLLTQARAVPYFKDGKAVGLRLFAIKTGSLYDKVGLRNGDILLSINGSSLGDFNQAMKLFERLKQERDLTLELERNRATKTFRYRIQ